MIRLMRSLRSLVFLVCLVMPLLALGQGKVVLGSLGQAMAKTAIYASPNSKSKVFFRLPAYEYLVIKPYGSTNWYRVLMENGVFGFVSKDKVAQLPYEVATNPTTRSRGTVAGSRTGSALAESSLRYVGTPYVWGGNDPSKGIDCSGFVKNVFGQIGLSLPRTASQQALVGAPIKRLEDLQAGDRLYFWEAKRNKIGHTGIYLGNGYFVHSSSGRGGVATDYLGAEKWRKILVAARR